MQLVLCAYSSCTPAATYCTCQILVLRMNPNPTYSTQPAELPTLRFSAQCTAEPHDVRMCIDELNFTGSVASLFSNLHRWNCDPRPSTKCPIVAVQTLSLACVPHQISCKQGCHWLTVYELSPMGQTYVKVFSTIPAFQHIYRSIKATMQLAPCF